MKLKIIAETGRPISDGASYFSDLIDYLKQNKVKHQDEHRTLFKFLKSPTLQQWKITKYIITNLLDQTKQDPAMKDRRQKWASLYDLDDAVAQSSIFAIDPKFASGTPFAPLATSKSRIKQLMRQMGPGGWIMSFSGPNSINASQLRRDLVDTERNSARLNVSLNSVKNAGYHKFNPF